MPRLLCVGKFIDPCTGETHPEGGWGGMAMCDHCHRTETEMVKACYLMMKFVKRSVKMPHECKIGL